MKRAALIPILFLYLIAATGMTVAAHYCKGKIVSVKFKLIDTHKCPCGTKAMKKDCCKNETIFFKITDEQQKAQAFSFSFKTVVDLQVIFTDGFFFPLTTLLSINHFSGIPPPLSYRELPIYIQNRVFRI